MLDEALQRLPDEIKPVEVGVTALQCGHDAKGLRIVIKAAACLQAFIERGLASMPEWRMTEIMPERQCLGEILVKAERAGDRSRDLLDFERVRQPRPVVIAFVEGEDLRLVLETPEGRGMDDPVAVPPEVVARCARRLRMQPSPALGRDRGIGRAWSGINGHFTGEKRSIDVH